MATAPTRLAMDRSKIKVTDRRLFTEDGELRTDLEEPEDSRDGPAARGRQAPAATGAGSERPRESPPAATPRPPTEARSEPGSPQFLDLVDLLCQQIALALGDPRLGPGAPPPDLHVARVYIDLLAVLQEKTRGNLTPDEDALLEDLIYRFRMLYVEKQRA
jgi:hypothetical protein